MDDETALTISTDVLVVGAGPAGASLACFLGFNGIKGLMISSSSSTAETPRAHYTNPAALECLRDIGLEEEFIKQGTPAQDNYKYYRWVNSMAGEEYARSLAWGHDPTRIGDYIDASPCKLVDLPQSLSEPILVRYATQNGFQCRWNNQYLSSFQEEKSETVVTTILDTLTGQKYRVRSKYLAGADGARSEVVRQLGLSLTEHPSLGIAYNVLVDADLSHVIEHSSGLIHCLVQPDKPPVGFAWWGIARMVKPWHEWLFVYFAAPGVQEVTATVEDWAQRTREFIGDDSVEVTVKTVSKWRINECYANEYAKGKIFGLGDAVHRHPPQNGFGSNTCIQDAYNLAWKIAYHLQGKAGPAILDTYNPERQPIGKVIVTCANDALRHDFTRLEVLGMLEPDLKRREEILEEFRADSDAGRRRREAWRKAVETLEYIHGTLGAEMNQRYESSAIYLHDEPKGPPEYVKDPVLYYQKSTYPGSRLPHAWLNRAVPIKPLSTHDLAGKGGFALLTGIGGKALWAAAAEEVSQQLGVNIRVSSIGWRQDYDDPSYEWEKLRGVGEHGAVLVRPDRFVAWRCQDEKGASAQKLGHVMRSVLGLAAKEGV